MRKSIKGRFRVWDLGTDQYSHLDLAHNWDKVDEIVGGPDGGPGTSSATVYPTNVESTWIGSASSPYAYFSQERFPGGGYGNEQQIVGKSLYNVIAGLNYNDVPLGTVVAWWTPFGVSSASGTIPGGIGQFLPDGWEICDGSTISAANHSFPTSGKAITLPDLRNKTVLGATNLKQGIDAVEGYDLFQDAAASPFDGAASAPGVGYDSGVETEQLPNSPEGIEKSGSNVIRDIKHQHLPGSLKIPNHSHEINDHIHLVENHSHTVAPHSHNMAHQHHLPNHIHRASPGPIDMNAHASGYDRRVKAGTDFYVSQRDHVHNISGKEGSTGGRLPPDTGTGLIFPEIYPYNNNWVSQASYTSYPVVLLGGGARAEGGPIATPVQGRELKLNTGNTGLTTDNASPKTQNAYKEGLSSPVRSGDIPSANAVEGQTANWPPVGSVTNAHEINPRTDYVGLLYIMKVKVSTNII